MSMVEPLLWSVVLGGLAGLNLQEGRRHHDLEAQVALAPKVLYQRLAKSQVQWQIVDVRTDLRDGYEDAHIPGALPFPSCDPALSPEAAKGRALASVPTIIVSEDGSPEIFAKCASYFTSARNLGGGMAAWSEANLPEDTGEYVPPKSSAGGGCL